MEELKAHLRSHRIKPWIDKQGITPGQRWRDALLQELRSCDKVIAILSPAYLESEHCRMELFIARSFGKPILPIMTEDCFLELRAHEETKGLEDIFMMRLYNLSAVGLPISREDALKRISDSVLRPAKTVSQTKNLIYISYSTPDGEFASELATRFADQAVGTWIATRDIAVGENWRDAQARAMMRASAHLVVLDENLVRQNVLRTEILLSEARGLRTLAILPPRLNNQHESVARMLKDLDTSDQTYRRLAATQYFSCDGDLRQVCMQVAAAITKSNRTRTGQPRRQVRSGYKRRR
jgi:hypothetical protein